jgi:hypothetical protein
MAAAKNFVRQKWVPGAEGASGATGCQGPMVRWLVLFWGNGEREGQGKGVVYPGYLQRNSAVEGPDAFTVA